MNACGEVSVEETLVDPDLTAKADGTQTAAPLPLGISLDAAVTEWSPDYYAFSAHAGDELSLSLARRQATLSLIVYGKQDLMPIPSDVSSFALPPRHPTSTSPPHLPEERHRFVIPRTGTYFVKVAIVRELPRYTLDSYRIALLCDRGHCEKEIGGGDDRFTDNDSVARATRLGALENSPDPVETDDLLLGHNDVDVYSYRVADARGLGWYPRVTFSIAPRSQGTTFSYHLEYRCDEGYDASRCFDRDTEISCSGAYELSGFYTEAKRISLNARCLDTTNESGEVFFTVRANDRTSDRKLLYRIAANSEIWHAWQ